jgi:hypothetical protein
MKHIHTFENFINEGKTTDKTVNESTEDAETLADDWGAEVIEPNDLKAMAKQNDDVSKWIVASVNKLGAKNQFYLTSKLMVQDDDGLKAAGLRWPLFLKILKSGGFNYEELKSGGDHTILFC